jgi:F-type H+-transporting ATPase subunit b
MAADPHAADPHAELTEGTVAHGDAHAEGGGLPQMDVNTYPSQLFWLVVTFGFLLVVLSRLAMPAIRGGMEKRQSTIQGDLGSAEELHRQAAASLEAYEASLAGARGRALALADANRKQVMAEVEKQKTEAEAKGQAAMAAAESRIAASRMVAASLVQATAKEAAADIVERLIGERVSDADAAKAVEARG